MKPIDRKIPPKNKLIESLPEIKKKALYKHFEGAADPDHLIHLAWLWANGWVHDPSIQYHEVIDPETGESTHLEVLDLDNPAVPLNTLYHFWRMKEVEIYLSEDNR